MDTKRGPIRRRRGVTLLEMLIYLAVMSLVAVSTLRVVGDSRVVRANARDRSMMGLIAQTEIERARTVAPGQRVSGREEKTDPAWPEGVQAVLETTARPDGTWLLDVRVNRSSLEGKPGVRLTTILPGGTS